MESLIPKENLFFLDLVIFFGGDIQTDIRRDARTGKGGGGGRISCHMSTYHLSTFSTVQWGIGLCVRILFLGDEVLSQHGMTSWLPM